MKDHVEYLPALQYPGQHYRVAFHKPQGSPAYVYASLVTIKPDGFEKIYDGVKRGGEGRELIVGPANINKIVQAFAKVIKYLNDNGFVDTLHDGSIARPEFHNIHNALRA